MKRDNLSLRKVSDLYKIPTTVLHRRMTNEGPLKTPGGQPALSKEIELYLSERMSTCSDWGYPLDSMDIRCLVKSYLDRKNIYEPRFKNNLPGQDWVKGFLKRHKEVLAERMCQNIKRARAGVSRDTLHEYFNNLSETLKDVPPGNILNYDETNLSDDPGRKRVISRRGCKYPERIMNSTKSAISVMYAACADGTLLPPYVVYKSQHLYDTWTSGGPKGARFNRTKSGWFDLETFTDWFLTTALPQLKKKPGRKVMIGDNLSSHLSPVVISQCEANNIRFCFLPPNATHLCQPLDVSFFRPLKTAWRKLLEDWKKREGRKLPSLPKDVFPRLLNKLHEEILPNAKSNIKSGFRKCGIAPLNKEQVLKSLPEEKCSSSAGAEASDEVTESFINLLKEMRYGSGDDGHTRKKKE
jgi:hypothetical protein